MIHARGPLMCICHTTRVCHRMHILRVNVTLFTRLYVYIHTHINATVNRLKRENVHDAIVFQLTMECNNAQAKCTALGTRHQAPGNPAPLPIGTLAHEANES